MKPPTMKQIVSNAYYYARQAGLDVPTSKALADRVLQRVQLGGETFELVLASELNTTQNQNGSVR
jgi:hypothetical protein